MREAFARCPAVRPYVRSVSRAARPGRRRKGEGKNAEEEKDRPRAGPRAGAIERDGVCRQQAGSVPVYGESERSHRAPGRGGSAGVHRSGQRGKRAGNAARGRSSVRWTGRDGAGAPRTQGPGAIRAAQLFLSGRAGGGISCGIHAGRSARRGIPVCQRHNGNPQRAG